jgi:hypothetical protein
MSSAATQQRNYKKIALDHPSYKWVKKNPLSNTTSLTPSTSGGSTIQFEIPARTVWNPARTKLSMKITYKGSGSTNTNWVPMNAIPFSDLDVSTPGGLNFAKFGDFNELYRVLTPYVTSETELNDKELFSDLVGTNGSFFRRSNAAVNDVTSGATFARRYDGSVASQAYREFKYLEVGTANADSPIHNIKKSLGELCRHTVLELDKNLIFDEPVQITLTVAPSSTITWFTIANNSIPQTSPQLNTAGIQIDNIQLFICVETDSDFIRDITEEFNKGTLRVPFEFLKIEKVNTGAVVTNANQDSKISRILGSYLKRVYSWVASNNHPGIVYNDYYNIDNTAQAKIKTFYTALNAQKLQDFSLTCANGEDFMSLQAAGRLKDTCIYDSNMYNYNWIWVDMWERGSLANRDSLYQQQIQGLPIEGELIHSTYYDTLGGVSGVQVYMYKAIVVLRELHLSAGGTSITQVTV